MELDPSRRITAAEALDHEFLQLGELEAEQRAYNEEALGAEY
jgi:cell division control protein 7